MVLHLDNPTNTNVHTAEEDTAQDKAPDRAKAWRLTPKGVGFGVLGVVSVLLGFALFVAPYSRMIEGFFEGSTPLVEAACAAPIIAVTGDGSRALDANDNWVSDEPPCQRSAGFRLGLGGLLVASAAGLGLAARHHSRVDPDLAQ